LSALTLLYNVLIDLFHSSGEMFLLPLCGMILAS